MKNWKALFIIVLFTATKVSAQNQYLYQVGEVIGYNSTDKILFGTSVSISGDGKVLLVGAPNYNGGDGMVALLTFNGETFANTHFQLRASDATTNAKQGTSIALSADGKTAIVGGYNDNSNKGAAWIYTFDGVSFQQLGTKLTGSDILGYPYFGISVAISADGQTAVVGGNYDNKGIGATWVFTFDGIAFRQAGSKLVGTGFYKESNQGVAVGISADGKTIISGGNNDNNGFGAAWIFSLDGSQYKQIGSKLIVSDHYNNPKLGTSVAVSSNGEKAFVGGTGDYNNRGAVWVFQKSADTYTQYGSKLVGTNSTSGFSFQGNSIAVTPDAQTLLIGTNGDNVYRGSACIFTLSGENYVQAGAKLWNYKVGSAQVGSAVSITNDGKTAVLGCNYNNSATGGILLFSATGKVFNISSNRIIFNNDCSDKCIQTITVTSNLPYYSFYDIAYGTKLNYYDAAGNTIIDFTNTYNNTSVNSLEYNTKLLGATDTLWIRSSQYGTNGTINGINLADDPSNFRIYPNPNSGTFYLNFNQTSPVHYKEATLFNTIGKTIKRIPLSLTNKDIQLSFEIPPGIYFLKVGRISKKILVE